ncbi:S-4TM family putative pore-forming effector [Streptomyces phaeochromogenes]|uniref:S-4TM family putative pore-forming effector n=1 Tax=Streptomyces phaeochromogenes TaxID=1923 RepID=UPI0033CC9240
MSNEPGHVPSILTEQNETEALQRLRAMTVAHARAQRLADARLWISVLLAGAGLVTTLLPSWSAPVALLGGAWAVAHSMGLTLWESGTARQAALLQELFDIRLYGLPWNDVLIGPPPGAHVVSSLNRRFRGDEADLTDYYEVPLLPHPYDVLACQYQNLGWGARVRRRYARALTGAVLLWLTAGLVVGLMIGLSVMDLVLQWYVPSLGAVMIGLETCRKQRTVATERERVLALLDHTVAGSTAPDRLLVMARQIQDMIFQSRERNTRVPNWYFRRFKEQDRADFQAAMAELHNLVRRVSTQRG